MICPRYCEIFGPGACAGVFDEKECVMSTAQNPITTAAWADFIMWCEKQPETVTAFNAETGRAYMMKPKLPIEAMIDDATGKVEDDAFAFARWVTENHWGMEYAPEAFREECERRDREEG